MYQKKNKSYAVIAILYFIAIIFGYLAIGGISAAFHTITSFNAPVDLYFCVPSCHVLYHI